MDGYFLCATIDISRLLNSEQMILDVLISSNLSTFNVISSAFCSDEEPTTAVKVSLINMPLISSCFNEMREMSLKYSVLMGTLDYLEDTLKQISEAWEGIVVEFDTKLEKFASKLPPGAMSADLLDLLMIGLPSVELEHFLIQDLTEKGLKRMIGSIDASYLNVQRLVLKYLLTVTQSLNFFLSEIASLALASEKLEILGLTPDHVQAAQKAASTFWCKGIELQQVIDDSRKKFRTFFRWLHAEILKLSDEPIPDQLTKTSQQEIAFIADFLASFDVLESNRV